MITSNILAIDLAKNVFQVCKRTAQGQIVFNREVSRNKLKELLIKESVSLVSMEACSSSHYWAQYAASQGHHVKVISARIVKPFRTKQKTDSNDALAIATAAAQDHIHGTRISTPDEQALQSLERVRNLAIAQQTAQSNQIRGLLAEFGIIIPQGLTHLRRHIPLVIEDAENNLPSGFRATLNTLWLHFLIQTEFVDTLNKQLEQEVKADTACQKLMKLEGVGPIGALGLAVRLGKGDNFSCGREASASIGLTPKQHSSGGKERIGHISKCCADKRLRSTLYQGALAAIALANKTVRTAYALLKNDTEYQPILLA